MNSKDLLNNIVEDTKVAVTAQFDRNFERKAFFDRKWKGTNHPNSKGSLLLRTGRLRKSINKPRAGNAEINWRSNLAYASLQNEGGEVKVTAKMKSFFWAMYYKSAGAVSFSIKKKKANNTARNKKLTAEAAKWKALALQKVGAVMNVEQRQFIGWHPVVDQTINKVVDYNMEEYNKSIINKLKK